MANMRLIFPSGVPTQITYDVPINPSDLDWGYLDTDDRARAFDGTLNSLAGPRKKFYNFDFTNVLKTQADYFLALFAYQCPINLYLDGTNFDASVKIVESPNPKPEQQWLGADRLYSFSVRFEEV
jgi:hypothetical protein